MTDNTADFLFLLFPFSFFLLPSCSQPLYQAWRSQGNLKASDGIIPYISCCLPKVLIASKGWRKEEYETYKYSNIIIQHDSNLLPFAQLSSINLSPIIHHPSRIKNQELRIKNQESRICFTLLPNVSSHTNRLLYHLLSTDSDTSLA